MCALLNSNAGLSNGTLGQFRFLGQFQHAEAPPDVDHDRPSTLLRWVSGRASDPVHRLAWMYPTTDRGTPRSEHGAGVDLQKSAHARRDPCPLRRTSATKRCFPESETKGNEEDPRSEAAHGLWPKPLLIQGCSQKKWQRTLHYCCEVVLGSAGSWFIQCACDL